MAEDKPKGGKPGPGWLKKIKDKEWLRKYRKFLLSKSKGTSIGTQEKQIKDLKLDE